MASRKSRRSSILKIRTDGGSGDLHIDGGDEGVTRNSIGVMHKRVSFSHAPQVREFDKDKSDSSNRYSLSDSTDFNITKEMSVFMDVELGYQEKENAKATICYPEGLDMSIYPEDTSESRLTSVSQAHSANVDMSIYRNSRLVNEKTFEDVEKGDMSMSLNHPTSIDENVKRMELTMSEFTTDKQIKRYEESRITKTICNSEGLDMSVYQDEQSCESRVTSVTRIYPETAEMSVYPISRLVTEESFEMGGAKIPLNKQTLTKGALEMSSVMTDGKIQRYVHEENLHTVCNLETSDMSIFPERDISETNLLSHVTGMHPENADMSVYPKSRLNKEKTFETDDIMSLNKPAAKAENTKGTMKNSVIADEQKQRCEDKTVYYPEGLNMSIYSDEHSHLPSVSRVYPENSDMSVYPNPRRVNDKNHKMEDKNMSCYNPTAVHENTKRSVNIIAVTADEQNQRHKEAKNVHTICHFNDLDMSIYPKEDNHLPSVTRVYSENVEIPVYPISPLVTEKLFGTRDTTENSKQTKKMSSVTAHEHAERKESVNTVGHPGTLDMPIDQNNDTFESHLPLPCIIRGCPDNADPTTYPNVPVVIEKSSEMEIKMPKLTTRSGETPKVTVISFAPANLEAIRNICGPRPRQLNPSKRKAPEQERLSYGKFGFAKTPRRTNIPTLTNPFPHVIVNKSTNVTKNEVEVQTSPFIQAISHRKSTREIALNCTIANNDNRDIGTMTSPSPYILLNSHSSPAALSEPAKSGTPETPINTNFISVRTSIPSCSAIVVEHADRTSDVGESSRKPSETWNSLNVYKVKNDLQLSLLTHTIPTQTSDTNADLDKQAEIPNSPYADKLRDVLWSPLVTNVTPVCMDVVNLGQTSDADEDLENQVGIPNSPNVDKVLDVRRSPVTNATPVCVDITNLSQTSDTEEDLENQAEIPNSPNVDKVRDVRRSPVANATPVCGDVINRSQTSDIDEYLEKETEIPKSPNVDELRDVRPSPMTNITPVCIGNGGLTSDTEDAMSSQLKIPNSPNVNGVREVLQPPAATSTEPKRSAVVNTDRISDKDVHFGKSWKVPNFQIVHAASVEAHASKPNKTCETMRSEIDVSLNFPFEISSFIDKTMEQEFEADARLYHRSSRFEELKAKLDTYRTNVSCDKYEKWAFLINSVNEFAKLPEEEWDAILRLPGIDKLFYQSYLNAVRIERERINDPSPSYRFAMKNIERAKASFSN